MTKGEIHLKVEDAIEQIRPFLIDDGGNIELLEITNDLVVKVKLLGACASCNMSHMTMKAGVEDAIRNVVPEIKSVIAIEETIA